MANTFLAEVYYLYYKYKIKENRIKSFVGLLIKERTKCENNIKKQFLFIPFYCSDSMVGNVDPKIHSNKNRNNLQKYFFNEN